MCCDTINKLGRWSTTRHVTVVCDTQWLDTMDDLLARAATLIGSKLSATRSVIEVPPVPTRTPRTAVTIEGVSDVNDRINVTCLLSTTLTAAWRYW